ncbi:hypothetical protein NDU88_008401 [Pleurodeles waltl]|uniref:Retrotransposon gag domain-containing protein n=1 Tax=Pleurodeles waltl TaxID=8319 RepID=A0AAV7N9M1_PLEWA|nr:hypothetical protein NDU88_008401 [Pleurodeles waltl]
MRHKNTQEAQRKGKEVTCLSVLVPHQRHAEGTHVAPVGVSLETETRAACSRFGSCILGGAEWSQETETRGACSRLGNCTPSGAERAHTFPASSWSPWQRHAKEDRFTPTGLAEHRDACSHWNVTLERHQFYKRVQAEGESASSYVGALRLLAVSCDYKDFEEEMIKDQLVEKTNNKKGGDVLGSSSGSSRCGTDKRRTRVWNVGGLVLRRQLEPETEEGGRVEGAVLRIQLK